MQITGKKRFTNICYMLYVIIFPLFLGMVIYANEFETMEKQKLPEIKN